ncbi:hypothetical protein [Kitasatospora phosalacinea]|uniref:hypothetical protein n=1 Tax=Kitasatospora phosalacinea TaxID=2065 RepID=UPI0005252570|nr:hypothetical protein [Kitasatospora phosalacinea]
MIGRHFAHSFFDQETVEIPREMLRELVQDAAILSLTDRITTDARGRWAQREATYDRARIIAPGASVNLASTLRWLLAHHPETASVAYGVIAFTARGQFAIPTSFTAGWLASNIIRGGGSQEPLPDGPGINAFVQAATTDEALKQL